MALIVIKIPKLKRDYVGKRVRLLRDVETGAVGIPAGSLGEVTGYTTGRRACRIRIDKCECCGVAPFVTGLQPTEGDFEFVEEQ